MEETSSVLASIKNQKSKKETERRRRKTSKDLCIVSGCEERLHNGEHCLNHAQKHYNRAAERRQEKKVDGLCTIGGCEMQLHTTKYCRFHAKKIRETEKERRLAFTQQGLCSCGAEPLVTETQGRNCRLKKLATEHLPGKYLQLSLKLEEQNHCCLACGDSITIGTNAVVAHLRAVSRTGMTREKLKKVSTIEDIVWLCSDCNSFQGQMSWEEFKDHVKIIFKHNIRILDLSQDHYARHHIKIFHHLKLVL